MTTKTCGHTSPCDCPVSVQRATDSHPRVVIVGAGFGGLSAAKALDKANVHVTLIDRRNHHLFQPLLYQVATAGLSPNQIATPIRTIVRDQKNTEVLLGEVRSVDWTSRSIQLGDRRVPYDHLIIATGARHSYFGRDEWEKFAPGLKSLEDATELRKRILLAFERAELERDPANRARLLTFVVIGAGPTGVEMAGAIAELSRKALIKDFRSINPGCARVVLVEGGPRALGAFTPDMSDYARKALENLGVEVRLGHAVTACDAAGVTLGDARIETRCVIWAAGVMASAAGRWLDAETDRAGRVLVDADLSVKDRPGVFVIGDCAHVEGPDGKVVPGLAPAAKQQGAYVAKRILAEINSRPAPAPFAYADFGAMATVGRSSAIADFGRVKLTGFFGWLVWSLAHIYFLIGFRNRLAVSIDWLWSYLTFERGARLITGSVDAPTEPDRTGTLETPARAA
jgi:NADH:ubiquinone reductase (H+-translocating)